ncbi:MAG: methyltransferase domain-containing protein [Desulfurococcales archaeon]|jgi:SAM-dependent methyltransferase|nr:class I SAM-dependent methyltransferase [Candidatus Terraquivivens yellowstonensis]NAZ11871.1 methyltransferase domain-containing protein [Desulfurococcales archaeon]
MNTREALLSVKEIIERFGDSKAVHSYYVEFSRRLEVLKLIEEYCKQGSTVLDLGAQPFIISCALRKRGYNVVAFDINPGAYMRIAEACDVDVVRCDLERDELGVDNADCAVFTEVLEHLHYYYVPLVLSKISRALKPGGILILTTPNIASLFRRLRLLLGEQPIYRYHVREYTMREVVSLLREAEFEVIKAYYSTVNDLTLIDADPEEYLGISSFKDLVRIALKKHTKLNTLRLLATTIVKLRPGLRQLIVVVAMKAREPTTQIQERWG